MNLNQNLQSNSRMSSTSNIPLLNTVGSPDNNNNTNNNNNKFINCSYSHNLATDITWYL